MSKYTSIIDKLIYGIGFVVGIPVRLIMLILEKLGIIDDSVKED